MSRLTPVFHAETLEETMLIDPESKWAVTVDDASFQWEEAGPPTASEQKKSKLKAKSHKKAPQSKQSKPPAGEPFALRHVTLRIPRGQLTAIAGPVGSGKSSILQALIGEMKQIGGPKPVLGGTVGYCAQMAWIQNATLRDNVLFGADWEEERYWRAIRDASLLGDLELLPDGDLTEIGEKGISECRSFS